MQLGTLLQAQRLPHRSLDPLCRNSTSLHSKLARRRWRPCHAEERSDGDSISGSSSSSNSSSSSDGGRGGRNNFYMGDAADNLVIQEAATEVAEDVVLDDDDREDEKEAHGLEDLGNAFQGPLNDTQEKYKAKLEAKLKQDKEEEAARRAARSGEFNEGKAAYERGRYKKAVELLELARDREGTMSALGGDILMWMALAYQAAGDDDACIETYKFVEDNHPLLKVRNQAANLRFICQAPKLKRGPDEMVQIPVLKIEDRKKLGQRNYRRPVPTSAVVNRELSLEEKFWASYTPPNWTRNRYVWWAAGVLGFSMAVYSAVFLDR